jgi:PHO85 cyclin-5
MFIAAVILATKFTQDRVYSNRAWAKISGLDAREVGRCERALGDALEWRLWVGKGVADEPFLRNFLLSEELAKSSSRVNSGIARSKSDGALLAGSERPKTPEWTLFDSPRSGNLSTALKRSTSLASADLSSSSPTATPMLSDPAALLTPVNADIDAMDLERTPLLQHSACSSASSSFAFDPTPSSSFFPNEFSFTPAPAAGLGLPTPRICAGQYTPPDLLASHAASFSKFAPGFKADAALDPLVGFPGGGAGQFDMGVDDIVGSG